MPTGCSDGIMRERALIVQSFRSNSHFRGKTCDSGNAFWNLQDETNRLHAAHESFSSLAMLAEVPLAGLILSLLLRGPSRLWPPPLPLGRGPLGRLGGKLGREGPQPGHHRCEPLGLLLN